MFWKCYEYGDDLIQIFEFIDDQRAKSVRGGRNKKAKWKKIVGKVLN